MTHVKRYDTDYDDGSLIHVGPDGSWMACDDCLVPADIPRELLGEMIYRAMYEHKGGMWSANETQDVWFDFADRLMSLLQAQRAKRVTEP